MTNKIHRYEKIKRALNCIVKFNTDSDDVYKWHSYNIFKRALYRAIEECPGFVDSQIQEYCDQILDETKHTSEAVSNVKELAKKALAEISWEEKTGNDLYPCVEV